jgi:hypothetical protein
MSDDKTRWFPTSGSLNKTLEFERNYSGRIRTAPRSALLAKAA